MRRIFTKERGGLPFYALSINSSAVNQIFIHMKLASANLEKLNKNRQNAVLISIF